MLLGWELAQHVTMLNTISNCKTMVSFCVSKHCKMYSKYIVIKDKYSTSANTMLLLLPGLWKAGIVMPPALLFLLKIALPIQSHSCFHMNFRITFVSTVKNVIGIILMGIALNLQIVLGSMNILTILILPIYKHGRSLHILMSSSVSLFHILQFLL